MDIHQQIKSARERLGWSMERLAKEISEAERLEKPLAWQTIQQWESGKSAPKRSRMELVKRLLGIEGPPGAGKGGVLEALMPDELQMLQNYRKLLDKDRRAIAAEISAKAEERQAEVDEIFARYGVVKAAERASARRSNAPRASEEVGDHLKQQPLPLPPERDH